MGGIRRSKKPATEPADPSSESEWLEWCRRWHLDWRDLLVKQMVDWHLANGVVRVDWAATFRNWKAQDERINAEKRKPSIAVDVPEAEPVKFVTTPVDAVRPPPELFGDLFDLFALKPNGEDGK